MGQRLIVVAPRQVAFEISPDEALKPDEVRVKTLYSGISAGAELTQDWETNLYLCKHGMPGAICSCPGQASVGNIPLQRSSRLG